MPRPAPGATIRTQMSVPLRLADGFTTAARVFSFDGLVDGQEHLAFGLGDRAASVTSAGCRSVPLVRPHSECLTGDVFGSQRCDCGAQLREAVESIAGSGGYVLNLRQEGANGRAPVRHERSLSSDEGGKGRPHARRPTVGRMRPSQGMASTSACSTVTASPPASAWASRRCR
jgi:hypothetical protein